MKRFFATCKNKLEPISLFISLKSVIFDPNTIQFQQPNNFYTNFTQSHNKTIMNIIKDSQNQQPIITGKPVILLYQVYCTCIYTVMIITCYLIINRKKKLKENRRGISCSIISKIIIGFLIINRKTKLKENRRGISCSIISKIIIVLINQLKQKYINSTNQELTWFSNLQGINHNFLHVTQMIHVTSQHKI
eukprot:TRINITY_DN4722_c0_g1_i3.p1 TRINITY_DN4722_c0_g1~~TRINITY_DN4722_c0_g1_i3.p1  ORF type:complete len:191 (+),score=-14.24 TRINITY_DN4722_c0_g1_i3:133-705(+)